MTTDDFAVAQAASLCQALVTRAASLCRTPVRQAGSLSYCVLLLPILSLSTAVGADAPNYEEHVRPLFRDHCLKCHNADEANADLDLSSFAAVMKGSSSGAVVKAGLPDSSQLYRAMAHLDGAESMPPESPKLADTKLTTVREWIRGGLIAGKGGKSQLRSIGAMLAPIKPGAPSPMPESLPSVPLANTVRPPVPQALAASPGAPLFAVSGHEQILLFGSDQAPAATDHSSPGRGTYRLLGALPFPEGTIHDIRFSRNGSLLLAAGGRGAHSGRVVLFDVKTGKRAAELGDEVESVLAADVSSDHRFVALGGPNKLVKLYSTQTGQLQHRIAKHTDWVTAISFSPDGKLLATGDRSGGIHIWETKKGAIVFTLDGHKVRITDLSWRVDGSIIASAAEDGNLILWSMKDGFPLRNVVAHASKESPRYSRRTGIVAIDYSSDGRLLTTGRDGLGRVWSGEGQKTLELKAPLRLPVSAAFLSGGKQAVIAGFNGSLHVFDLQANTLLQTLTTSAENISN